MFNFETGYIGKISEDFTFDTVRNIAREIAAYLKINKTTVVGYDSRFLADKFAEEIVKVMEVEGISCYLLEPDVPIPVLAFEVEEKGVGAGVMVGGGSLPYDYCGVKFIKGKAEKPANFKLEKVERFNPKERYLKYLEGMVDVQIISRAKLKIIVDPMHGSARGYLDKILMRFGCKVEEIHDFRDVLFGGRSPDPKEENLKELKQRVAQFNLGLAYNSDASEFAIIAESGRYYSGRVKKDSILESLRIIERFAQTGKIEFAF